MTKAIAGPDPSPVKPSYAPPSGACDAHCHIFGPAARFPYAPERRYTPPDSPKEKMRALHEHLGLSRAVLVQASCHGADNRAMLDAIAWSRQFEPGGAWRGVAMVGNRVSERELEALQTGGVRGVRFNFVRHLGGAPDPRVFERTLAKIAPLGGQGSPSTMRSRSQRPSPRRPPSACYRERTSPIPTSRSCRTTASWSTSLRKHFRTRT
jgi:hypothetical protein